MYRIYTLMLASLFILSGCSTNSFGVSQKEWEQLTPEQKTMVIEGYNQRKQREAELAPLRDAVSAIETGIYLSH